MSKKVEKPAGPRGDTQLHKGGSTMKLWHNSSAQHGMAAHHASWFYSNTWHTTVPNPQIVYSLGVPVLHMSREELVQLIDYARTWKRPNVYGARIPTQTRWNIPLMRQLADSVADREVVEFMQYGWSLNHDGCPTTVSTVNHASAERFPEAMDRYIHKETSMGCLLGPFI